MKTFQLSKRFDASLGILPLFGHFKYHTQLLQLNVFGMDASRPTFLLDHTSGTNFMVREEKPKFFDIPIYQWNDSFFQCFGLEICEHCSYCNTVIVFIKWINFCLTVIIVVHYNKIFNIFNLSGYKCRC